MSTQSPTLTVTQDQYGQPLDEVTLRGLAIYEHGLKNLLEPEHTGEVVAIHVDSGDYVVAASSPEALRGMRQQHSSCLLFLYTIGPASDHGLARRVVGVGTGGCNSSMKPLSETNPYLRDPQMRRRLLERNALDSSVFEGARGLKPTADQSSEAPRRKAVSKKVASSS